MSPLLACYRVVSLASIGIACKATTMLAQAIVGSPAPHGSRTPPRKQFLPGWPRHYVVADSVHPFDLRSPATLVIRWPRPDPRARQLIEGPLRSVYSV